MPSPQGQNKRLSGAARQVPTAKRGTVAVARPLPLGQMPASGGALPATSGAVAIRNYGDIVASDEVHDEIRALGGDVRSAVAAYLPRDGTSEGQALAAVRQFGPSRQSRRMLNRENEAAMLAREKGIYIVYRCLQERVGGAYLGEDPGRPRAMTHGAAKMLSGATDDFCTRVGYRSVCFCGHNLACHAMPAAGRGAKGSACEEAGCPCRSYRYVPNCPEEIGEGWLSRRREWDPKKWSAKCRCGHGGKAHDAGSMRCRECRCGAFASHFVCVVCDQPWEAHETVFETETDRLRAGRPVGADFFPLSDVDWEVRALVLKDPTGNGAIVPPAGRRAVTGSGPRPRIASRSAVEVLGDGKEGLGPAPLPDHCPSCATVFRSHESKFCTKCGRPRRG